MVCLIVDEEPALVEPCGDAQDQKFALAQPMQPFQQREEPVRETAGAFTVFVPAEVTGGGAVDQIVNLLIENVLDSEFCMNEVAHQDVFRGCHRDDD